ncbi:ion channel [Prolixibacter sp. NT017]|uniref:ion channel n=1 Tax=Prolixibacter sp. NT017 TaxID=2652390 RepID=UPI001283087B|nr:ion channel [Prolixibacter sp. NT017]GET25936.1 ion channel protein [Prolixibacter sp. NT017]
MQTISIFTPYIQWIKTKVANKNIIELRKDLKIDDLLFSEIGLNNPETFNAKIAPGHEVLYLGNVKITNDKLSGRNLDFTNLSYIEITGKDFSDFEPKSIYYSICFHSKISKSTIYNLHFHKCEFEDFRMSDSNFYSLCFYNCQLWTTSFNDCRLEDAIFSKTGLDNVSFYGVVTNNLFYTPKKTKWPKGQSYLLSNISKDFRTLKTLFQQNGNQKAASEAYYKEKKFKLKANINSINLISPFKNGKKYGFKVFQNSLKNQMINLKSLLLDGTSYMLWGFGEKPIRTLFASSIILVLYTFLYYFSSIDSIGGELINSFYLSTTMFTTLGFGDFSPFQSGSFKFLLTSEALLGIFIFGLFVAGYANKSKY